MINSNKKHFYIFILIVFFIFVHNVKAADLEITKVNYNPTVKSNHLWLKIHNTSSGDIDLTSWNVADYDGVSWHYHAINAYSSVTLASGSYAVIAKASSGTIEDFKLKNPDITDQLFYGNLTIENEGTIALSLDKKTQISPFEYGGENNEEANIDNDSSSESTVSSSSGSSNSSSHSEEEKKIYPIKTNIIAPKIVVANIPFVVEHQTTGIHKEKVILGKFVWNFGDGMVREFSVSDPFPYIYYYPGDYVLGLSFYDSVLNKEPDATDRINIKVIPSGISISSVGDLSDPFIEIYNNSNYEMSLRDWVIRGVAKSFVIPNDTVVLPGKKIKFSPKITGFDYSDLSYISIADSSGQIFATYPKYNNYHTNASSYKVLSNKASSHTEPKESEVVDLNNLEANVINSSSGEFSLNTIYPWAVLTLVIVIGSMSIVLIRRKDHYEDYIEKEVSAKDMTIIE